MPCYPPSTYQSHLADIPSGIDGIRATLKQMVKFARQGQEDMNVITLARQLTQSLPPKDYKSELTALQHFVRDKIRYVRDPRDTEMVQDAPRTLSIGSGDCDDKSVLLASLLLSIGFPAVRFAAVGFDGGMYSHVLPEVRLGTRWIPSETILPGKEPGWYPDCVTRRMEAHI